MGAVSTCGQPACPVVRVPWAAHHRGRCAGRFDGAEVRKGASELSRRPPPPIPFDEFAKRWLRVRVELPIEREEEESLSLSSARSHEQQIRLYLIPFLGSHDVRKLNVALVDGLWDRFIETGKPRSRRSREIALGTLRRILGSAVAKEILLANPVDQWKAGRPIGRAKTKGVSAGNVLDSEEREEFLRTAKRVAPHYYPFVLFLAETGCRISEAIDLRWVDVDLDAGSATLRRQKTGLSRYGSARPSAKPCPTSPRRTPPPSAPLEEPRSTTSTSETESGAQSSKRPSKTVAVSPFTGCGTPGLVSTWPPGHRSSGSRHRADGPAQSYSWTPTATSFPAK